MSTPESPSAPRSNLPYAETINTVHTDQPFQWLVLGWRDFRKSGLVSITYGLLFAMIGLGLTVGLVFAQRDYLIAPLAAGFILVAPALTVGLYAVSRDLESGQRPTLQRALTAWRANSGPILGLGLALLLFLIIWIRLAVLIFALTFPYERPSLEDILASAVFTAEGNVFLLLGCGVGMIMAALAFSLSVVSLPMLLDRKVDMMQAVVTSVVAVVMNVRPMLVWAALIVVFTGAGLLAGYVGLAVTLPLIGHASWHAYRAVVRLPD